METEINSTEKLTDRYFTAGALVIRTGDWEAFANLHTEDMRMVTPRIQVRTPGNQ